MSESHFHRLWSLGYHALLPIVPPGAPLSERSTLFKRLQGGQDARGKVPGIKRPDGNWSSFDWLNYETTEHDLDRWAAMGAGVGIKAGVDGVVLIDADTMNKEHAYAIKRVIDEQIGAVPVRVGRSPKAGYVLRCAEQVPYQRIEFGTERIEVLSGGRQFVAEGMHPSNVPYRWAVPLVALGELPAVTPQQITDLLEALRKILPAATPIHAERSSSSKPVDQNSLRGDPAIVAKALAATPNTVPDRETYITLGVACKAALGEEGFEVWSDWAGRWEGGENKPDIVAEDWKRMNAPFKVGANWLYDFATKHGSFSRGEQWFEAPGEHELFPKVEKERKRLQLTTFAEAADTALTHSGAPLIDGLLDQGAMSVLYGESGAGKSFVTMDMAYHIATGLQWASMPVTQTGVLYVAAEGGPGTRKRAAALRSKFGPARVPFEFVLSPIDLLHPDADTDPLINTILDAPNSWEFLPKPLKVGLVVIDTFSRALAGGEENGSTDMGVMVRHFDKIRAATAAHLLIIHHSGKDRAKGARGHSLLRAATDTEIEVAGKQISVTKQRDLEAEFCTAFEFDTVGLGVNINGKPVTSATIRLVARNAVTVGIASPREHDVLDAIESLLSLMTEAERSSGVAASSVVEFLASSGSSTQYETIKTSLRRLAEKHLIRSVKRGYWTKVQEGSE